MVGLICSSVDTLQSAFAALVVNDLCGGRVSLPFARVAAVGLNVPALFLSLRNYNILQLFLVADLLAAGT
jgi:hypothetical protein